MEDGEEYVEVLREFLDEGFVWVRAGTGGEALQMLEREPFDAVFLDMRFDRVPLGELLGDWARVVDRFNGDERQARAYLEEHQGLFILAALRERGHRLPVLLSYDFRDEPERWARIRARYGPVDDLADDAPPSAIGRALLQIGHG